MQDYQELYLTMIRASEQAIRVLIEAQQQCEDIIINESDVPEPPVPKQQKGRT